MPTPPQQQKPSLVDRLWITIALVAIALASTAAFIVFREWNLEDSYIIYRIVQNITKGEGWAFNSGEIHNASTSALNTIVVTIATFLVSAVPLAAHLLGALWIALSSAIVFLLFRREFGSGVGAIVALGGVYILAHNATWGLETHLLIFLALLFIALEKRALLSWGILGLAILARPDAILLAGLKWMKELVTKRSLSIPGSLICAAVLLPWFVFSLFTFGQLFPDTLGNKIWQGQSGYWGSGWIYLAALKTRIFGHGSLATAIYIAGALGALILVARRSSLLYLLLFTTIQQLAYSLLNVPGYHWYFAPFEFALYLSGAYGVALLVSFVLRTLGGILPEKLVTTALVALALAGSVYSLATASENQITDSGNRHYLAAARSINQGGHPEGALAAVEVGTLGYLIDRQIVDMVALTSPNPEFVSGKHNDAFFEILPRIVLVHWPLWNFEQSIVDDLRFKFWYDTVVDVPDSPSPIRYFVRTKEKRVVSAEELEGFLRANFRPLERESTERFSAAPQLNEHCVLDKVNGKILFGKRRVSLKKGLLSFEGWAVDMRSDSPSREVYVLLMSRDRGWYSAKATRIDRGDVAQHLNRPTFQMAGYLGDGLLLEVPPGEYSFGLALGDGESFSVCKPGIQLVVAK